MDIDYSQMPMLEEQPAVVDPSAETFLPANGRQKQKNKQKNKSRSSGYEQSPSAEQSEVIQSTTAPLSSEPALREETGQTLSAVDAVYQLLDDVPELFEKAGSVGGSIKTILSLSPMTTALIVGGAAGLAVYLATKGGKQ